MGDDGDQQAVAPSYLASREFLRFRHLGHRTAREALYIFANIAPLSFGFWIRTSISCRANSQRSSLANVSKSCCLNAFTQIVCLAGSCTMCECCRPARSRAAIVSDLGTKNSPWRLSRTHRANPQCRHKRHCEICPGFSGAQLVTCEALSVAISAGEWGLLGRGNSKGGSGLKPRCR